MLLAAHLLKYVNYFLIKTLSGRIPGKTRACPSEGSTAHKRWMTLLLNDFALLTGLLNDRTRNTLICHM